MGRLAGRAFLSCNLLSTALKPVVVHAVGSTLTEGSAGVVVCSRVYVLFDGFWFAFQESSIARSEKEATLTKEAADSLRQTLLASPSTEVSTLKLFTPKLLDSAIEFVRKS